MKGVREPEGREENMLYTHNSVLQTSPEAGSIPASLLQMTELPHRRLIKSPKAARPVSGLPGPQPWQRTELRQPCFPVSSVLIRKARGSLFSVCCMRPAKAVTETKWGKCDPEDERPGDGLTHREESINQLLPPSLTLQL